MVNQSNVSTQTVTEPVETNGTAPKGATGEKGDEASWYPNYGNGAPRLS